MSPSPSTLFCFCYLFLFLISMMMSVVSKKNERSGLLIVQLAILAVKEEGLVDGGGLLGELH